jgi:hypothetical protein
MKKDFRGLKKLRETVANRFAAGVVLYDGEHAAGFGEKLYAVPIRAVWIGFFVARNEPLVGKLQKYEYLQRTGSSRQSGSPIGPHHGELHPA